RVSRFARTAAPEELSTVDPRADARSVRRIRAGLVFGRTHVGDRVFHRRRSADRSARHLRRSAAAIRVASAMKSFPLTIRRTPAPVHKPAAWFVRGSSAADWLDEIAQWGVPFASLSLSLVPRSPTDPRPLGALVKLDPDLALAVSPRALPYACIAARFFLPMDALLSPPVADAELASLMGPGREAYVWHPATGLCGFDACEGCPVSRLIQLAARCGSDWGDALPGHSINQRGWSVAPEALPSGEVVMQELGDDIGSEADDLSQLPALPDEPPPGPLGRMVDWTRQACASVGRWLSSLVPRRPREATGGERIENPQPASR